MDSSDVEMSWWRILVNSTSHDQTQVSKYASGTEFYGEDFRMHEYIANIHLTYHIDPWKQMI